MSVSTALALGFTAACLAIPGCGDTSTQPTVVPDEGKKSAKYKDLHPEEFPVEKKKGRRGR
jgi:hypothetical protein